MIRKFGLILTEGKIVLCAVISLAFVLATLGCADSEPGEPTANGIRSLQFKVFMSPDKYSVESRKQALMAMEPDAADMARIQIIADAGLRDSDKGIRIQTAHLVGEFGPPARSTGRLLVNALKDEELLVRREAAKALGAIFQEARLTRADHRFLQLIPGLRQMLKSETDPAARRDVIIALGRIGPEAKDAVPDLIAILQDKKQGELRLMAGRTLSLIGPDAKAATAALLEIIRTGDKDVEGMAYVALGKIDADEKIVVPLLIDKLEATFKDPKLIPWRFTFITALGSYGPAAKPAIPTLLRVLEAKDMNSGDSLNNRINVLEFLSDMGAPAKVALPIAQRIADDPDEHPSVQDAGKRFVRHSSGSDVGDKKPPDKGNVKDRKAVAEPLLDEKTADDIKRLLLKADRVLESRDSSAKDRKNALAAIAAATDNLSSRAKFTAIWGLRDEDKEVRIQTARWLGQIGPRARDAGDELVEALKDNEVLVRREAALSLGAIFASARLSRVEHKHYQVIHFLRSMMNWDVDPAARKNACIALGNIGPEAREAVPDLIAIVKDKKEGEFRLEAIHTLVKIGPDAKSAGPALLELIRSGDKDHKIDQRAYGALGRIGADEKIVMPLLITKLEGTFEDPKLINERGTIISALQGYGPLAKPAIPGLLKTLQAKDLKTPAGASDIRISVLDLLAEMGEAGKVALPIAERIAEDPDEDSFVRRAAERLLLELK